MTTHTKARDTAPRVPAAAPPKGFRKYMPLKVKLEALLIHGAVYDADGRQVTDLTLIQWDHCPAVMQREYDALTNDTIPPVNDPRFIVPRAVEVHRKKTAEKDIPEIAKTKRLSDEQRAFRGRLLAKGGSDGLARSCWPERTERAIKRKIPSRSFPKGVNNLKRNRKKEGVS